MKFARYLTILCYASITHCSYWITSPYNYGLDILKTLNINIGIIITLSKSEVVFWVGFGFYTGLEDPWPNLRRDWYLAKKKVYLVLFSFWTLYWLPTTVHTSDFVFSFRIRVRRTENQKKKNSRNDDVRRRYTVCVVLILLTLRTTGIIKTNNLYVCCVCFIKKKEEECTSII